MKRRTAPPSSLVRVCVSLLNRLSATFSWKIFYILEVVQYLQVCEAGCGLAWQCQKDNSCVSIHQGRSHSNAFKIWENAGLNPSTFKYNKMEYLYNILVMRIPIHHLANAGGTQLWDVCDGQCIPLGENCSGSCLEDRWGMEDMFEMVTYEYESIQFLLSNDVNSKWYKQ